MKKTLLLKTMLLLCAILFGTSARADEVTLTENFSSSGASSDQYNCGSNISTASNRKDWNYVWTPDGSGTVFKSGIKLGGGSATGSVTNTTMLEDIPTGTSVTIKIYAAVWNTDGGKLVVSYNGSSETKDPANSAITSTSNTYSSSDFSSSTNFTIIKADGITSFTIATSAKRILIDKVEVTYEDVSYTITAQSNNTEWGTVSKSGNVITATPATGYTYADPAYSVSPANSATVSQEGDEFTVTPSANTTVTINFEAIPTHSVTWSVNGTETSVDVAEGEAITFPADPADLGGKKFVGWTAAAIPGTTDDAPTFVTTATMGDSDLKYYAVFANVSSGGSSDTYALVSDADNLSNGDKIILVSTGQYTASKVTYNFTVANGTVNDSKLMDPVDVTISDNKVTSTDVAPITLVAVTGGWKLQMGTQYLNIVPTKNNIVLDDDGAINSISIASDEATIGEITDGNDTRNLVYNPNSGNGRFAYYKSAQKAVMIFKQEIGETYSAYCTSITVPVTIPANKEWITFCSTANLDFSEAIEGLEGAYTITAHESQKTALTATKMTGKVAAGTGLLLRAAEKKTVDQTVTIPVATTGDEQAGNMLKGVTADTEVQPTAGDYTNLGLSNGEFHPYSAEGTLAAGKAYLQVPTAQMPTGGNNARLYIVLDGEATGINAIENSELRIENLDAPMYNLAGQRVTKSYKGVVIVNGKKFINK